MFGREKAPKLGILKAKDQAMVKRAVAEADAARKNPENPEAVGGDQKPQLVSNQEIDEAILGRDDSDLEGAVIHSREYTQRFQELQDSEFSLAKNWTTLYAMLKVKGGAVMANKKYSANEVIAIIDEVRANKTEAIEITRTAGLRDKVLELIEKQS